MSGAKLTVGGVRRLPVVGPIVLTVGLLTFVFSTILGWSYYGEKAVRVPLRHAARSGPIAGSGSPR